MGLTMGFMRLALALAALVALPVAEKTASMSTMPLFFWSGHRAVMQKPASCGAALESSLASGKPELVMVYMLDEVSTHRLQKSKAEFTNLEDALSRAESSTFAALPVAPVQVESLIETANDLQGYMAAHPEMMTNQKPDVLVVRFEADMDMATADALLVAAEKAALAATQGKVDSILSTTASEAGEAGNLA